MQRSFVFFKDYVLSDKSSRESRYNFLKFVSIFFSFSGIHQEAPEFTEMSVEQEILETGIKVVDLLAPYSKGGKIGK